MEQKKYISDTEREKCHKVANAFTELETSEKIVVLDGGRFGFIRLLYYKYPFGFDDVIVYTDSRKLFNDLWDDWLGEQIYFIQTSNPMLLEIDEQDVYNLLPQNIKNEFMIKRNQLAELAEIAIFN